MVKALLVSLLLSLSLQLGAQGFNTLPDHETFVHLPAYEQKKIIIGFMEFMVAMEDTSGRSPKTTYEIQERRILLEKLVTSLRVLEKFLLSSAHAQADTDPFKLYREDYVKVMEKVAKQTGDNICIYGGWISTIKPGTHVCGHPKDAKVTNYPKAPKTPGMTLGKEDIVCNPLIFGFKDPAAKTLLVAVATTSSVNSSLDCMQQSQGIKKNKDGDKVEDKFKDLRLQQLKDAYTSPEFKDSYNLMTKMIHQTCLCKDSPNHMDQKYLDKIKPHRTCFSLLNQYKHLREAGQCSTGIDELGLNVDSFKDVFEKSLTDMKNDLDNLKIKPEAKLTADEQLKLKNLDANFKLLLSKDAEAKFCEAQTVGAQVCNIVSCADVKGTKGTCVVTISGSKTPTKTLTVPMIDGKGSVKSIPTGSLTAVPVSCALPAPTCSVKECKDGKCNIDIGDAKFVDQKDAVIEFGKEASKEIKVIPKGLTDQSIFTVSCAASAKDPACIVSKCEPDAATGGKTCEFTVPGFATKEAKQSTFKIPKDYAEKDVTIALEGDKSVKCLIPEAEKKSSCDLIIVANEKDAKNLDLYLVLTILEGDTAVNPTWDPAITAVVDPANKNKFTATVPAESIKGKTVTAKGFSTKWKDEKCEEVFPKAPEAPSLELKQTKRDEGGKITYVITVELKVITSYELVEWKGGHENKDKDIKVREVEQSEVDASKDDPFKVCASHKEIDGGKEKCEEIKKTAAVTPETATLSLVGTNRSNQNFDVKATVTLKGKAFDPVLSDGYTLVWFEKGKPALTVEEQAVKDKKEADKKEAEKKIADKTVKKKTGTGQGGDSQTEEPKDAKTKTTTDTPDVKPVDGEVQTGTSLTYSAPIGTAKYEICANLMKDGKVEGTGCKTVPGYTAPVPQQMGPPPVPGAYRYRRW